jgi:hypothetical protein
VFIYLIVCFLTVNIVYSFSIFYYKRIMQFFTRFKNPLGTLLIILFVAIILVVTVRGLPGNPTPAQLNTTKWKDNGPFELSPERGRFALLYSIVENHTFHLAPSLAQFTAPDVGYLNHSYVSIFAPSISFLAIPGYLIGRYFGDSQFGTFLWMSLFALFNVLLIRQIAIRLGAHPLAATIATFAFLFGTPAFAYAVTVYEHHPSTFLILLSFYLLMRFDNLFSYIAIWILYGFAFTVDYPNLFMMFPVALAAFLRSGVIEHVHKKYLVKISLPRLFSTIAVIIPLAFLLWFNRMSYGNPLRLSGSVPTIEGVNANGTPIFLSTLVSQQLEKSGQPTNTPPPSTLSYFQPRNMLNGFYILLISPDRGVVMYAPVVLFGIAGFIYAGRKKQKYVLVLLGIAGADFILYSMWGDPYGGWAFGGRYLIPAYSVLSIYMAIILTRFGRNKLFILLFFIIFSYSIIVNTLGAVTSNSNPPQIQAVPLSAITHSKVEYTYMRNVNDLNADLSKSFVFQAYAKNYMSAWQYYSYIAIFILIVSAFAIFTFHVTARRKKFQKGTNAR